MFTFVLADQRSFSVKFHHSPYNPVKGKGISRRTTTCIIRNLDDNTTVIGVAECSKKDNFCKVKGRELSLARAVLSAFPGQENKAIRDMVWMQYFMKLSLDQEKN